MNGEIFKITAIVLIAAVTVVLIKTYRPEYAIAVSIAASVTVLCFIVKSAMPFVVRIKGVFSESGADAEYFAVVLKSLGISYISGFAADTCRDFGQTALAAKSELAGKCAVFVLCIPLMTGILKTALGFAGV